MNTYLIVAIAAVIAVAAIWLAIRAATGSARREGSATAKAEAQARAREAEAEMSDIQGETITPEDLRKRVRDGTFGGQDQ